MIDPDAIRRQAREGASPCADGSQGVVVSARWLEAVANEIEAGRQAQAQLGAMFGVSKGVTL